MGKPYTTSEAAKHIGVSRQTLYSWIERRYVDAPKPLKIGGGTVRLWTMAEIRKARKFKATLKPGPRPRKKRSSK
jgi:excisionase family DNA binding protein